VIADPPLLAGGAKPTEALVLPGVTLRIVGEPGRVTGVTLGDDAEAAPVPTLLVAVTENVYAVPLVSPLTVIGLDEPLPVIPPGLAVTV
jgi:hypothetical protein